MTEAPAPIPPDDAPPDDSPIAYLDRIASYYQGLGYGEPYRWPAFETVPFTPLARPLSEVRIALVTTAAPFDPARGDQGPGAPYNGAAKFYKVYAVPADPMPDLRISHIAYDRVHTTAEDPGTWLPLAALREATRGNITQSVFGLPTNRSQATTMETDAPDLLARLRAEGAGAAVLVPNCPVCHLSCALAARHLEARGIPTVIMGCALDIVERCGVPRFLFSDFPLGNGAGRPHDPESQRATLALALRLLETAPEPRTTVQNPLRWASNPLWKRDYSNIALLSPEEIAHRRAEFDRGRAAARVERGKAGLSP